MRVDAAMLLTVNLLIDYLFELCLKKQKQNGQLLIIAPIFTCKTVNCEF